MSPFNWFTTVIMIPVFKPFKPQDQHTNSPNWSPYISLKNELREFDNRSKHFPLGDYFIYSHNISLDSVWILLWENWSWSLLGLKGLTTLASDPSKVLIQETPSQATGTNQEGEFVLEGCNRVRTAFWMQNSRVVPDFFPKTIISFSRLKVIKNK